MCYVNKLAANDGCPRALQACKGKGSRRLLDEGEFKGKEVEVCGFWITFVVNCIKSRGYISE